MQKQSCRVTLLKTSRTKSATILKRGTHFFAVYMTKACIIHIHSKKVSPPFQNGSTFCTKCFEQSDSAGLFLHIVTNVCVKMKLVHCVTHECTHKVPISPLICAHSCMTRWINLVFTQMLVNKCRNNPAKLFCSKHFH